MLRDGEPCSHKGCLNHIFHPCEGCGRIAGKSNESIYLILKNAYGDIVQPDFIHSFTEEDFINITKTK
jgi:hypothetical protein